MRRTRSSSRWDTSPHSNESLRICLQCVAWCPAVLFKDSCGHIDQFRIQHHGMNFPHRNLSNDVRNSFQGVCSSIATTFNTPLTLGGPSSVRTHLWISCQTSDSVCAVWLVGRVVLDSRGVYVLHAWIQYCGDS